MIASIDFHRGAATCFIMAVYVAILHKLKSNAMYNYCKYF